MSQVPPQIGRLQSEAQNREAESAILGAWLQLPELIERCPVPVDHFASPANRDLASLLYTMWAEDQPIDLVSVGQAAMQAEKGHLVAKIADLFSTSHYIGATQASYYAETVSFYHAKRRTLELAGDAIAAVHAAHKTDELTRAIDTLETDLLAIQNPDRQAEFADGREALAASIAEFMGRSVRLQSPLKTGFSVIDNANLGLRPGSMSVVCARPSVGKTALMLQMLIHMALKLDVPVGIFSLEMPKEDLLLRVACHLSGVNWKEIQRGTASPEMKEAFANSYQRIPLDRIKIDDTPGLSVTDFAARARRMKRQYGVRAIGIDYLQLLVAKGKDIYERATAVSNTVKNTLRRLELAGIVLVQLNRDVEKRGAGVSNTEPGIRRAKLRPVMSDLRDSGALEQDADDIWALWADHGTNEPSRIISSLKGRNTGWFPDIDCLMDFDSQTIRPSTHQQDEFL